MFNKYTNGGHYGTHVDSAIRQIPNTPHRLRTDLSATLFLSDPDEYQGGELTIEDANGFYQVKLPAGDMILYESGRMHNVSPVTEGSRIACVFWVQSMVRSAEHRSILLDLDISIQTITQKAGNVSHAELVRLTGVYHNLLRLWGDC
jgi:PKHD-type hydroxylase